MQEGGNWPPTGPSGYGTHPAGQMPGVMGLLLAREAGLSIMIGCMTESTVGISAAAQLLPFVDYADLDGPTLAKTSSYEGGIAYKKASLSLSEDAGLGIAL